MSNDASPGGLPVPLLGGIDRIYLSVADFLRSEAYYDALVAALGLKKGDKAIAGEPHAHYLAPNFQLTIRPARGGAHDPYAPGLHHLCFQAADRAAVDACYEAVAALNFAPTRPRVYPEYNPEYYATFFEDPDGIRLEVVARTGYRRTLAQRFAELEGFLNPLARLEPKG